LRGKSRTRAGGRQAAQVELDPQSRARFAYEADAIRKLCRRMITDGLRLGRILLNVRAHIESGMWVAWLREINFSLRGAQRYMALARKFSDATLVSRLEKVALRFDITAGYILTMESSPPQALPNALTTAEGGQSITPKVAQDIVAAARGENLSAAKEETAFERKLGIAERAMQWLAERRLPPSRSAERRAGDARRFRLIKARAAMLAALAGRDGEAEVELKTEADTTMTMH
jgi:hypothetical protein